MNHKIKYLFASILMIAILIQGCEQFEPKPPEGTTNKIEIENETLEVGSSSLLIKGHIKKTGNYDIVSYGHCWSMESHPDTSSSKTDFGITSDTVAFTSSIVNLTPGEIYYLRAYAIFEYDVAYSEVFTITTTTSAPVLATTSVTNITTTGATSGGTIISNGGAEITAKGICWDTVTEPTIADQFTVEGTGNENFTSVLTNLIPGITYYVRAYATNTNGTGYGNEVSFNSSNSTPEVTTIAADSIRATTAYISGEVINNGGLNVSLRGFCWDLSPNPTIADNSSNEGSGIGEFANWISGLLPDTTYYVRAYATNGQGTGYGNEINFSTINTATVVTNPPTNVSSNEATIGGNVTNNGGNPVTEKGICWSENPNVSLTDNVIILGSGNGAFETTLTDLSPGMTYYFKAYATNIAGTSFGEELSFTTDIVLASITTKEITDTTGTTAVSGGTITNDGGGNISAKGVCWSTTPLPTTSDNTTNDGSGFGSFTSTLTGLSPNTGYYVRAYAINEAGTAYGEELEFQTIIDPPTVSTTSISGITPIAAQSGGNVTFNGGATVTARGVCWSATNNPTIDDSTTTNGSGLGSFVSAVVNLDANTSYFLRAYATNSAGTGYGQELTFTTLEACEGVGSVTYEGQVYTAIEIGNQCWIKENLNAGTKIDNLSNQTNNDVLEKYCYEFNDAFCDQYGGLYQWDELMQYGVSDDADIGTTQGICPPGWHIPTSQEWITLASFLGGKDVAGGKMKEVGTTNWESPNEGATNESGFTGLPSGLRETNGVTQYEGFTTFFWSATSTDGLNINARSLGYQYTTLDDPIRNKDYGFSVRCIKDITGSK